LLIDSVSNPILRLEQARVDFNNLTDHYPTGKYAKGDLVAEARFPGDVTLAKDFMVLDM
jgi:hypothetical protein